MLYEKAQELSQLSVQKWVSEEVFSLGWFLIVGILIVSYIIWLMLLDRSRGTELLLIGSLEAVINTVYIVLIGNVLGLIYHNIRLFPITVNIFITGVTLSPIIVMLVQQYTTSWKGYMLWTAIGFALMCFIIFPIFVAVGILEFHKGWNVFYHFLGLYAISLGVRFVFLWIIGAQKRKQSPTM